MPDIVQLITGDEAVSRANLNQRLADINTKAAPATAGVTQAERSAWDGKAEGNHNHDGRYATAAQGINADNALAKTELMHHDNLLINSDLRVPINQRNQSSYSTGVGQAIYTYDHWLISGQTSLTYGNFISTLNFTNTSGEFGTFNQKLSDFSLRGLALTASCFYKLSTGGDVNMYLYDYGSANAFATTHITGDNQWHTVTITGVVPKDASGLIELSFNGTNNSILDIQLVKLEIGNYSTLNYYAPPNISLEELKCFRYFKSGTSGFAGNSSQNPSQYFAFPVTMRTTPRVDFTDIAGNPNSVSGWNGTAWVHNIPATLDNVTDKYFRIWTANKQYSDYSFKYAADAEI